MFRVIIFLILILASIPANADVVTTRPLGYNNFNSKLKLNQPKTIYTNPTTSIRQNRLQPPYCHQCHRHNSYLSKDDLYALETALRIKEKTNDRLILSDLPAP